ncbi:RING-type domain-containing protein [Entamoeba marina]
MLRVCVNCATPESGPAAFNILMEEDETIDDLISRLKVEFAARKISVDTYAGPTSIYTGKSLKSIAKSTASFNILSEEEYIDLNGVEPKEFVSKPPKPKRGASQDKEKESKYSKRSSIVGERTEANPDIKTLTNRSCHKCRQKRDWVYMCPNNEKHRFCKKCIDDNQLDDMIEKGCPICLGSCVCCMCKKKQQESD